MRIADIKTHVLFDPGYDASATSSAQDAIVVEVVTDEGIVGVGETDLNAWGWRGRSSSRQGRTPWITACVRS